MDLETIGNVVSFVEACPLWLRGVAAFYGLYLAVRGNWTVLRDAGRGLKRAWDGFWAARDAFTAWRRRPSKRALEMQLMTQQLNLLTNALLGSPTDRPA